MEIKNRLLLYLIDIFIINTYIELHMKNEVNKGNEYYGTLKRARKAAFLIDSIEMNPPE